MRIRFPVLWHASVALFSLGLWLTVQPAQAGVGDGDNSFTWGQVCVLLAVAAAWGDMRAQLRDVRKDVDELKENERSRHEHER